MKKFTAFLTAVVMCTALGSCSNKDKKESSVSSSIPEVTRPTDPYIDDAVEAQSGEVYLAVADSQWKAQYLGTNDGIGTSTLSYDAGVVEITGNGDYTVSVNADTEGFRYAVSGNSENKEFVPKGMEFMAVMIKEGETKFPDAVITVNEIRVDGTPVELTAKAYTSSDDGINTRANLITNGQASPHPMQDVLTVHCMTETVSLLIFVRNTPLALSKMKPLPNGQRLRLI